MDNLEEFKKLTDEKFVKYYNKHFVNSNIYNSMYEGFKDATIELTRVYISFEFLIESINTLKKDKKFYDKLPESQKDMLEQYKMCIKYIADKIFEILDVIQKSLIFELFAIRISLISRKRHP